VAGSTGRQSPPGINADGWYGVLCPFGANADVVPLCQRRRPGMWHPSPLRCTLCRLYAVATIWAVNLGGLVSLVPLIISLEKPLFDGIAPQMDNVRSLIETFANQLTAILDRQAQERARVAVESAFGGGKRAPARATGPATPRSEPGPKRSAARRAEPVPRQNPIRARSLEFPFVCR